MRYIYRDAYTILASEIFRYEVASSIASGPFGSYFSTNSAELNQSVSSDVSDSEL